MEPLVVVAMLVLGPVVGSFLGVVVRRLPLGLGLGGRSRCEGCGRVLGVRDLVPLASYVWLLGRCRRCGGRIGWRHPAIELAGLVVAGVAVWVDGGDAGRLMAGCVLGWGLLALGWIDWEHMVLPNVLTLPLVVLGLGATEVLEPEVVADHAAAAALGYAGFGLVAAGYRWWRGREGLGMGDAKLMAAAGAWVGLAGLAPVMLGGALLGLVMAGVLWVSGCAVGGEARMPFGPFLAIALWVAWLVLPLG